MIKRATICLLLCGIVHCSKKEQNVFNFCRDFDPTGCITPVKEIVSYPLERSTRNKTIRDFANSVYFRGDRLAFEVKNAHARWDITFECLRGFYFFGSENLDKHELEYLELRENNVYGLVMLGSLIEKKYVAMKALPYRPLNKFPVTYTVACGKDVLAKRTIEIELR